MIISLNKAEVKALKNMIDMVLSITADIKKGDPDYELIQNIWKKLIDKSK